MFSIERASGPAQLTPPVLTPLAGERVRGLETGESSRKGDILLGSERLGDDKLIHENDPLYTSPLLLLLQLFQLLLSKYL